MDAKKNLVQKPPVIIFQKIYKSQLPTGAKMEPADLGLKFLRERSSPGLPSFKECLYYYLNPEMGSDSKPDYKEAEEKFKLVYMCEPKNLLFFLGYIATLLAWDRADKNNQAIIAIQNFLIKQKLNVSYDNKQRLLFLLQELGVPQPNLEKYYQFMNLDKTPPRVLVRGLMLACFNADLEGLDVKASKDTSIFLDVMAARMLMTKGSAYREVCQKKMEALLVKHPENPVVQTTLADVLLTDPDLDEVKTQKGLELYKAAAARGFSLAIMALFSKYRDGVLEDKTNKVLIPKDSKLQQKYLEEGLKVKDIRLEFAHALTIAATNPKVALDIILHSANVEHEPACSVLALAWITLHYGKPYCIQGESAEQFYQFGLLLLKEKDLIAKYKKEEIETLLLQAQASVLMKSFASRLLSYFKLLNSDSKITSTETFVELHRKVIAGDVNAEYVLGKYLFQETQDRDLMKDGFAMLTHSANQNQRDAQYCISHYFRKGYVGVWEDGGEEFVKADVTLADFYLVTAADQKHIVASYEYYYLLATNKKTLPDALIFLENACNGGHQPAITEFCLIIANVLGEHLMQEKFPLDSSTGNMVNDHQIKKIIKEKYKVDYLKKLLEKLNNSDPVVRSVKVFLRIIETNLEPTDEKLKSIAAPVKTGKPPKEPKKDLIAAKFGKSKEEREKEDKERQEEKERKAQERAKAAAEKAEQERAAREEKERVERERQFQARMAKLDKQIKKLNAKMLKTNAIYDAVSEKLKATDALIAAEDTLLTALDNLITAKANRIEALDVAIKASDKKIAEIENCQKSVAASSALITKTLTDNKDAIDKARYFLKLQNDSPSVVQIIEEGEAKAQKEKEEREAKVQKEIETMEKQKAAAELESLMKRSQKINSLRSTMSPANILEIVIPSLHAFKQGDSKHDDMRNRCFAYLELALKNDKDQSRLKSAKALEAPYLLAGAKSVLPDLKIPEQLTSTAPPVHVQPQRPARATAQPVNQSIPFTNLSPGMNPNVTAAFFNEQQMRTAQWLQYLQWLQTQSPQQHWTPKYK